MLAAQPLSSFHANSRSNSPASTAGTPESPIVVCGPREAVVTGAGNYANKPYGFLVRNSTHVMLAGFTITRGFKGVCAGLKMRERRRRRPRPASRAAPSAAQSHSRAQGLLLPLALWPIGAGTNGDASGWRGRAEKGGESRHLAAATVGCASTGGWFSSSELAHTHPAAA